MHDKLTLIFAALERIAEQSKDAELLEYLQHGSQHSGAFIEEVNVHKSNLNSLDAFKDRHAEATRPVGAPATSYTKAEVDAMIAEAIKRAKTASAPSRKGGE